MVKRIIYPVQQTLKVTQCLPLQGISNFALILKIKLFRNRHRNKCIAFFKGMLRLDKEKKSN